MRALPQVEEAAFDIPSEVFTIHVREGADKAPVLDAIKKLGFEPQLLTTRPKADSAITHLRAPTSAALRAGLARATQRGVPLLIAVGGPFCPLCRRFENLTLHAKKVLARLASFEVVHVDIEADPAAAKDLDIHAVPDIWVLDSSGEVLARHNGFLDATEFLAFLDPLALLDLTEKR